MELCEEVIKDTSSNPQGKLKTARLSDCEYPSSSDEENIQKNNELCDLASKAFASGEGDVASLFDFQKLPLELQKLVPGLEVGLPDEYNPPINERPGWLDMEKFKLGQEFARKYFVGVNMSQMLSLYMLFAFPDAMETLIFTKKSSTPFTSFKRYLSTIIRVSSWYDYDIWSQDSLGYRNMKTVRGMHLNVSKKINSIPFEDLKSQVTLAGTLECPELWSDMKHLIQEDFQSFDGSCLAKTKDSLEGKIPAKVLVNQLDMSVTQFGFMGLMVSFPEKFGAGAATKEELEGYVHMWRGICYLLGVQDKYNFCDGSFEDVLQRCHSVIEKWGKPSFKQANEEWEHMSRVLAEGMTYVIPSNVSFEATVMYMCWVLEVPAPNLYKSLTTPDKMSFHMMKFIMTSAVRVPGLLPLLNWQSRRFLEKAASMSKDELKELEERKYDYQEKKMSENQLPLTTANTSLLGLLFLARLLI